MFGPAVAGVGVVIAGPIVMIMADVGHGGIGRRQQHRRRSDPAHGELKPGHLRLLKLELIFQNG